MIIIYCRQNDFDNQPCCSIFYKIFIYNRIILKEAQKHFNLIIQQKTFTYYIKFSKVFFVPFLIQ